MPLDVNADVWGEISQWVTYNATGTYLTYLKPSNAILSWSDMVSNDYQTINQDLDFSIAPWRISKKSAYVDIKGHFWYNNKSAVPSDAGKAYHSEFEILEENKNIPFLLTRMAGSSTTFAQYNSKYWAYEIGDETKTGSNISPNYQVTNFRYDMLRLVPYVVATDKDMNTGTQVNLYSDSTPYGGIPLFSEINGKFIITIGFRVYADVNSVMTELPLTITIPTHFKGSVNTSYFAGARGMKILRHPYIYNASGGTHYNTLINDNIFSSPIGSDTITQGEAHAIENCYKITGNLSSTSKPNPSFIAGKPNNFVWVERVVSNANIINGISYLQITSQDDYDNLVNTIKKELAYIGLPFCLSVSDINESFDDDKTYLPVFDSQRCTTGNYTHGSENARQPNYEWRWIYNLPELPPDIEPQEDPVDYGDTNNRGIGRHFLPVGYNVYLTDSSNYNRLVTELTSYYLSKTPDDWTLDFQGVNPSDYIIGAYVSQISFPHGQVGENIKIGTVTLQTASAYQLDTSQAYWQYFSYGTRKVTPYYEDFRDYAPYTEIELYLPLAGTLKLDTNYCMGHSITVEYYYDITTMSGVAAIYRDDMLYKCQDFQAGSQIPFLSSNMGSYQNQLAALENAQKQNNVRLITSGVSAAAGITSLAAGGVTPTSIAATVGGLAGVANALTQDNYIDYQIEHTAPAISQTGAAESQNALSIGQLKPKLIIKRPIMLQSLNDSIYSRTVGNACCINTTVGNMSGLIVCSKIDVDTIAKTVDGITISPTADEINAIKQAAANGIII